MTTQVEWDFFLWLFVTGALVHLLALAWLCKGCMGCCVDRMRQSDSRRPRESRVEAGRRWVDGDFFSELLLAGDPGARRFGESDTKENDLMEPREDSLFGDVKGNNAMRFPGSSWSSSCWDKMKGWMSPSKRQPQPDRGRLEEVSKLTNLPPKANGTQHFRKGPPVIKSVSKNTTKGQKGDKLQMALASARNLRKRGLKNPSIERDFCAASSKDAKNAKKRTVSKILEVLTGPSRKLPLVPESLKGLASALSEGGYRAGEGYLIEAKLWHVEEGHPWNDALDRTFKQCKRALSRGQGPPKRAKEVDEHTRKHPNKLNFSATNEGVKFGAELFLMAFVWMLREIELAGLCTGDVIMDHLAKRVTLNLSVSKMDPAAKGVKRTLQCLCTAGPCQAECPYFVSKDLVEKIEKYNGTGSGLALTKGKTGASKAQIIKTWRALYGKETSGHSGRRSGALAYIRSGWSISQVAHLGRWKSSAILAYAEEALEQLAANLKLADCNINKEGLQVTETRGVSEDELKLWKAQLRREMGELKSVLDKKDEERDKEFDQWVRFYKGNPGSLPKKVQSLPSKVVHWNLAHSAMSPPLTWKSACGWCFYASNFVFAEPEVEDEVMAEGASAEAASADSAEDGADPPSPDVEEMLKKLSRNCQDVLQQSAKLRCLSKLLPDLAAKGHRTLVFSQSVKMLDLVQICCLKPNGLRCLRIDGLTETQARAEKVAKFNNQPERFQCMLLTTAVGGVGLNLTAADRVVLVDPAWNPATDAQAVDRAYRIGQTKEVRVYRLIMSGMVEDKMFRLQVFKMGLTRTALEADQQHRYFTVSALCGKAPLWGAEDQWRGFLSGSWLSGSVARLQDFFSLLDQDLAASKLYVQSNVSGIEAMIGEWQVAAVKAGLVFTPQQLDEVRSQLPDWLLSLTPGAKAKDARLALVDKPFIHVHRRPELRGCGSREEGGKTKRLAASPARVESAYRKMANEEQEIMESSDEEAGPGYATLARDGPKESMGSVGHPDGCTPCTFYCFTRRGCNRGADCKFCHMTHQSKLQQRREAWKKQQREKRKLMRGFAHKDDAPEAPQRPQVVRGKKPLTEEAVPNNGTSSVKSVVFTYTPSRVTLTTGQQTEIRPALFGPSSTTRRFSVLSRLPEGLTLDHQTGTISGVPEVFTVQAGMGRRAAPRTELEPLGLAECQHEPGGDDGRTDCEDPSCAGRQPWNALAAV
eukprot:s1151_g26.t1